MQLCAKQLRGAPGNITSSVFATCLPCVLFSWFSKIKNQQQQQKRKSKFENSTHIFLDDFDHNLKLSKTANYLQFPHPPLTSPKLAPPLGF